jgi:hypothetical protein
MIGHLSSVILPRNVFEGIGLVLVTLDCRLSALRPVQVIKPDEQLRRARKDLMHAMRPAVEARSRWMLGS